MTAEPTPKRLEHPLGAKAAPLEIIPARSLHRKLAQVMYEADRIPKNGTAPREMGGYKFVQVGDAADYIRKALAEKVITMMPTAVHVTGQQDRPTKSGGTTTTVDLVTEWTLTDGESGESITIMSFGAGADVGDKYSGKASTSAMKYALLTGFLLSTGEDSELGGGERAAKPDAAESNDGSLIGTVAKGKPPVDYELRQTPEGPIAGFKLTQGRGGLQVLASGNLAGALATLLPGLEGQRVAVWGTVELVAWAKDGKDMPPYKRLILSKIQTAEWTLPGNLPAAQESDGPEAPGNSTNTAAGHEHWDGEPSEAESAPLFTEGEWAGA